jgi:hypothetical protein
MSENRMPRRMFGTKRDKVRRDWIRLHSEELYNSYSSADIIREIKSDMMRLAGHVARAGR